MSGKPLLVLAAGGTGGHMFPAQALAEHMLAQGWRVKLATDRRGARYAKGFPSEVKRVVLSSSTFARGGIFAKLIVPFQKVVYYYRPSPDRTRVLFGGRVSAKETNTASSGPKLHNDLVRIFPELSEIKVTHSWFGTVAYTFDELAHTGCHDGIYYSMGYCGSGVSMASYLGMRLGQKVLGLSEGKTAFDDLPFPTKPLYSGNPWFLPAVVSWYRWRDKRQIVNAR